MNALTKDLAKLTDFAEELAKKIEETGKDEYRQKFHLMPPVGWLNDPNGLCQFHGVYHAFFQYSPFDPEGGVKMWGHYSSQNLIDWDYQGTALYPDQVFDCHGVYSGSAFIEDDTIYLYYTGNVKLEDGDYDYINNGREGNTILVTSQDGFHFSSKQLLMKNSDYPENLSCHVRDPKVWKEDDTYYMVQGARTKNGVGLVLVFESKDKIHWDYKCSIESEEPFGYMWECPDYFELGNKKILSTSAQGLEGGLWEDRNVYQSGYFEIQGDILGDYKLSEYKLWDYGFDYYAPQSFQAEDGRRIHISWMGMPDCEEYTNPTIASGWQHCFTFPREIYLKDQKLICQRPVSELEDKKEKKVLAKDRFAETGTKLYDVKIEGIKESKCKVRLCGGLNLEYTDGRFSMRFDSQDKGSLSAGRGLRYLDIDSLENLEILADVSSVEVFVNDGEFVFSSRYYPTEYSLEIEAPGAEIIFSKIR